MYIDQFKSRCLFSLFVI